MMQELTRQEKRIVELLAEGYTNHEITDELKISYKTTKNHIYKLMQKLGVGDRTKIVVMFYKEKIKRLEEELEKVKRGQYSEKDNV